jgi:uncharacterized membrane protein
MLVWLCQLCPVLVAYVYHFVWCLVRCISSLIQSGIIKKFDKFKDLCSAIVCFNHDIVKLIDSRVQIFEERVMHVLLK